jgi:protein TonB
MNGPLQRGGASQRAFHFAVLASLVFHGSLLFLFSLDKQAKRESAAPGPIIARLVAPAAAPPPAPTPPQPEPAKPRAEPAPKPPVQPVIKPAPAPKPSPVPSPVRRETSTPPVQSAPPQPASPSAAEPAPAAPAAPSAPVSRTDPQAAAPAAPSADTGTLEIYRMDLMRMARNYKRYPRVALDNNWEGRVVVRMVIGANGMIASISVLTSAGHEVLDKQALDMIQKAKPRVQIPAALRGREFSLEIPVIYNLKDQASG